MKCLNGVLLFAEIRPATSNQARFAGSIKYIFFLRQKIRRQMDKSA